MLAKALAKGKINQQGIKVPWWVHINNKSYIGSYKYLYRKLNYYYNVYFLKIIALT
jgi:hypothetical protein